MRNFTPIHTLFTDLAATGAGIEMDVKQANKVIIELVGGAGVTATAKIRGCFPDRSPDWDAAGSATNNVVYLGFKNMDGRTVVAGDTGLAIAANTTHILEVDGALMGKINVELTAVSGGSVTARAYAATEV